MFFHKAGRPQSTLLVVVLPLIAGLLLSATPARAADKLGNSLDFVPADASFYSASLRLKEQLDILLGSKAFARLKDMPAVKMGFEMVKMQLQQPGGPKEQFDRFMENPDNQRLLELVKDMGSNEFFIYGDKKFADSLGLAIEAFNAARYAPLLQKLADRGQGGNDERVAMMAVLQTLNENLDRLVVPQVVVGFKITDGAKADLQMRRLETLVNVVVQLLTINEYKDRFGRVSVGGSDFLELRLDGKLVPWEELPFDDFAENPGDFEPLKQHLRSLKLTINLGIKDGYALFSIGESHEHLANLGKGELLVSRREMKPLIEHLSKRLVSVGYSSKQLNSLVTGTKDDVEHLVDVVRELLPHADLDEELEKRIVQDIEELSKEIGQYIPEPGAAMSFSFLTPRGYEAFSYNWTQNLTLDDSKPLTLLDHVGGSPLLAAVGRTKHDPKGYDMLVKWIQKGYGYFEEFAVPQMSPEEQEKVRQVTELALPLIKRVNDATRNDLIPALAEGQSGIVLDADITSKQWHTKLPAANQPLPMVELALVFGVSDADRLKKAFREYKAVAETAVDTIRRLDPNAIPAGYQVPDPKSRESSAGQVFWYAIPPELGLDPQVQPAAGLSKSVAVLSTSAKQVDRMLATTPLKTRTNLIGSRKTAGSAVYFDFAGLIDAVEPWAQNATTWFFVAVPAGGDVNKELKQLESNPQFKTIREQIHIGAEILKCFRGATSVSYLQDGATVTHSESIFEDLK